MRRRCLDILNDCGFDCGGHRKWFDREGCTCCHAWCRHINIPRSDGGNMDAASRYDSADRSCLRRAATVVLSAWGGQVTKALHSRGGSNDQKHHHRDNNNFGFT